MTYKKYYSKKNRKTARLNRKKRGTRKQYGRGISASSSSSKGGKNVFGIVHAKWCGFCKSIMTPTPPSKKSIWDQTKDLIGNSVTVIVIEESEITPKLQNLNEKYGVNLSVNGFPTIFKIKNGTLHTDFSGERTPENLAKWAKE